VPRGQSARGARKGGREAHELCAAALGRRRRRVRGTRGDGAALTLSTALFASFSRTVSASISRGCVGVPRGSLGVDRSVCKQPAALPPPCAPPPRRGERGRETPRTQARTACSGDGGANGVSATFARAAQRRPTASAAGCLPGAARAGGHTAAQGALAWSDATRLRTKQALARALLLFPLAQCSLLVSYL
jgi:hypothetical protein